MAFLSITSMYLYKFIIPQLTYVKLLLKNHNCPRTSFGLPLLAYCNELDLIAHDF